MIKLKDFEIEEFVKEWEVSGIEVGYVRVSYLNPFFEICLKDPGHPCHNPGSCNSCEECPHKYLCDRGEYVTECLKAVKICNKIYFTTDELETDIDMQTCLEEMEA